MKFRFLLLAALVCALNGRAFAAHMTVASDPYLDWAQQHWGANIVNDPTKEATVWGQGADPDGDGYTNLQEYAFGTDPTAYSADPVTWETRSPLPGYSAMTFTERADDAALLVYPQYSDDLDLWLPLAPRDSFSYVGSGTVFFKSAEGPVVNGFRTVTYLYANPAGTAEGEQTDASPGLFTRLNVLRSNSLAVGSPFDALNFVDTVSGVDEATVESNPVLLTGFAGSAHLTASGGAHLLVNGTDAGTAAKVPVGSVVKLQAKSASDGKAGGGTATYALGIGSTTRTWNVVTKSIAEAAGIQGTPSGYTAVSASVGESGAANISIPITVSPGTGGMEPKLAITYSSQGGNGLLGMGFGLSGLSAITRTGPVQYFDRIKGGVAFGPNDRFTLDGQRLVLFNGTWGGDGTEYRTEQESFSKIVSQGTTTAGPLSWIVKTKAGLTYEYGTSTDSRILANRSSVSGDTAVLMWALTRIRDANGNSVEFTYATPDGTESGNPRILSIAYTKNANLTPGEQVVFSYETRPDARTSYVAGAKVVVSKRLTAIECQQGGNVARRYEFAYQQAGISNNSQLVSVTEKGKKPTSSGDAWQTFPATTFAWDQKSVANMAMETPTQVPALASMQFGQSPPTLTVQGDFDGSGHMGLMYFDEHGGPSFWLATGKNDGSFNFKQGINDFVVSDAIDHSGNSATYSCIRTGDFNSDGKTDVVNLTRNGTDNWVGLSRGDGTFQVLRGQAQLGDLYGVGQTGDYTSQIVALDINGDGRTDLVIFYATKSCVVLLGNGDGSFKKTDPGAAANTIRVTDIHPEYQWVLPGDYNGDGVGDILFLYRDNVGTTNNQLLISKGDGTFDLRSDAQLGGLHNQGFALSHAYIVSGDFNGDGLTDVYNVDEHGDAWVSYAKGDGTFETTAHPASLQGYSGSSHGPPYSQFLSGDFNGDGFSDIIHASYDAPGNFLIYSQGNGVFSVLKNGQMGVLDNQYYATNPPSRLFAGDFDGDGFEDILCLNYGGTTNFLSRSNGFSADRVVQVTNGHGGYTKFSYKPLTDPTVYTKGTTAVYPYYDVIGAMYVVASTVTRNAVDGDAFTVQSSPTVVESTTTYTYERAWSLLDGHGYQGFAAVQSTNQDTGITSRTEYVTGDPYLSGHPAHAVQTLGTGVVVGETINSWDKKITSSYATTVNGQAVTYKAYLPYTTQSVTKDYEINNGNGAAPIKTTTISGQAYDSFGNLLHSFTDYGGGFTEETSSIYTNDTGHWWLGRLTDTVVKQTSPGPVSTTRHSTFAYSTTNGQLTGEDIVAPEPGHRLQKTYVHDKFGNISQSTLTDVARKVSRTTTTIYTPDGRFIAATVNAMGQVERKTYDPLDGTVRSQTGPNGLTTLWTYDGFGRPIIENRPDTTATLTQYLLCTPGAGVPPRAVHCVRTVSSGSKPSTVYFDILDRQIRQDATGFDGRTVSTHAVYNAKGQTSNTSLPFFSSASAPVAPGTRYASTYYDAIGRAYEQQVPGAATEDAPRTTITNYSGLIAKVTNPQGETFQTTVDLRGRTTASTSFGVDTVSNTHDPYGNLIKVDDNHGHVTTMIYDGRGNKASMTEPNSGTTLYGYDAFGELTSQQDALGRLTTMFYDPLGRLVKRVEEDIPGVKTETDWVYEKLPNGQPNPHGVGKLSYVYRASDGYMESYSYDLYGRLNATQTQLGSLKFLATTTFDQYSRPDILRYPNGFTIRNAYNGYGHLAAVADYATPSLRYWTATSVNARGQIEAEELGNGLATFRAYDANTGLLQSIKTGKGSGADFAPGVQNLAYTFDNLNNLTQRQDLGRGVTEGFTYDKTNQLSGVTCSAADSVGIVCNDLGNIVSRTDVGTYTYGENGAGPHAVTSIIGTNGQPARKLSYNAVGNCIQDGTTRLAYNAANQPISIFGKDGSFSLSYTPSRARLKRTELVGSSATTRLYVGSLYEQDDTSAGLVQTCFIPAASGVVAIHTQTLKAGAATVSQTRYVHKDHLGSVQTLTDETGSVAEVLSYDAWGRRRTLIQDPTTQTLRYSYTDQNGQAVVGANTDRGFTGHEMLDAVGLIHMNGRIYDPTIGRFLSVDPVVQEAGNLQNLNRYCYVLNNPLSLTDPSGFSFLRSFGKVFERVLQVAAVVVSIVQPEFSFLYLAAISFGEAFTGTLLSGGSIGDAFRAGAISGGATALTAGQGGQGVGGVLAHSVIQGGAQAAEGGRFTHGFFSAAFADVVGSQVGGIQGFDGAGIVRSVAAAAVGGTASTIGGGKFANGAVTGGMAAALGGSYEESDKSSDHPVDISLDDITNFTGSIVNLPLAIPVWAAGQLFPSSIGSSLLFDDKDPLELGGTRFGTGDHTGWGMIVGDNMQGNVQGNDDGGAPGLLGVSMMLAHVERIWSITGNFEAGQLAHNNYTGGPVSEAGNSIMDTFGQGVGIFLKHIGVPASFKGFVGSGGGYDFTSGFRSGLTPNESTYSDDGYNK